MILILILILILSSSALSLAQEPAVDLECFNDYDSEMVCQLDSRRIRSCSEYSLNATLNPEPDRSRKYFQCGFRLVSPESCECQFQVPGFVYAETFRFILWRGETSMLTNDILTAEIIKPRKPINVSVNVTENGNFWISWSYNYSLPDKKPFVESLRPNLSYRLKGSKDTVSILLEKERTEYELVGTKLQPNSQYIVTASVSTDYNDYQISSDESDPVEFRTSESPHSFIPIVVISSCIIFIIFIFSMFYCYIRFLKEWWDKIPDPKKAPSFEKPVQHWAMFQFSLPIVYMDTVKVDQPKEKSWKTPSLIDVSCENSYHSVGKSGNSSHVSYGQAGFEDAENGVDGKDVDCELLEEYQFTDRSLAASDSSKSDNNQTAHSGNSSCFSNKCYLGDSSGSSFLNQPITHTPYPSDVSEHLLSSLSDNLEPVIPTEFEYGPCNGCPGSTDVMLTQDTQPDAETMVVFGYQSVNELQNNENKPGKLPDKSMNHEFINFHNNLNLQGKPGCFLDPQDFPFPGFESDVIVPVDDGYQSCPSFQGQNSWSSDQSNDLEHSISQAVTQDNGHEPSFKSLCGPVLHVSPGIQIDCSYQRV